MSVGHEDAQASIITAGLQPGASVVVDGASRLTDGSRVSIVTAARDRSRAGPAERARNRVPPSGARIVTGRARGGA